MKKSYEINQKSIFEGKSQIRLLYAKSTYFCTPKHVLLSPKHVLCTGYTFGTGTVRVLYVLCTCFVRISPMVIPAAKIIEFHHKKNLSDPRGMTSFYQLWRLSTCSKDMSEPFCFFKVTLDKLLHLKQSPKHCWIEMTCMQDDRQHQHLIALLKF